MWNCRWKDENGEVRIRQFFTQEYALLFRSELPDSTIWSEVYQNKENTHATSPNKSGNA